MPVSLFDNNNDDNNEDDDEDGLTHGKGPQVLIQISFILFFRLNWVIWLSRIRISSLPVQKEGPQCQWIQVICKSHQQGAKLHLKVSHRICKNINMISIHKHSQTNYIYSHKMMVIIKTGMKIGCIKIKMDRIKIGTKKIQWLLIRKLTTFSEKWRMMMMITSKKFADSCENSWVGFKNFINLFIYHLSL